MSIPFRLVMMIALVAALLPLAPAGAQEEPAAPATRPAAEETTGEPTPDTTPSLDELLGIEEAEGEDGAAVAAQREAEEDLKRQLAEAEIGDAFVAAVEKMELSAELLDRRFDPGLGTQRVQEDVIRKLDQLIEFAKQQQSSASSSSSSSGSSSSQDPSSSPSPKQDQGQQSGESRNPAAGEGQEGDPPPRQEGDVNTVLEETRSEWGGLPPRIRDELLQGRSDKYSSLYEQLTREYYRRLAEEGSP